MNPHLNACKETQCHAKYVLCVTHIIICVNKVLGLKKCFDVQIILLENPFSEIMWKIKVFRLEISMKQIRQGAAPGRCGNFYLMRSALGLIGTKPPFSKFLK